MPAALAASVLLAAAGFVYLQQRDSRVDRLACAGELTDVRSADGGDLAMVVRGDGRREPAANGMELQFGDRIESRESELGFRYADEHTALTVSPGTVFRLAGDAGAKRVRLDAGHLSADVQHRSSRSSMVFVTPHAEATVIGTRLTLRVQAGRTRLDVGEGRVRFEPHGDASSVVCAGQFAETGGDRQLAGTEPESKGERQAAPDLPRIVGCSLIDARNGRVIQGFEDLRGTVALDLGRLPTRELNVIARTEPHRIGRVIFQINGREGPTKELNPPYAMAGNDAETGTFRVWTPGLGRTEVQAVPLDEHGRHGPAFSFALDVTDSGR